MQYYLIAGMVVTLVFAIFAVQNAAPVDVRFLIWKFEQISLVLVILISAIFGAGLGLLSSVGSQFRLRRTIKELNLQQRDLQKELENLKTKNLAGNDPLTPKAGPDCN